MPVIVRLVRLSIVNENGLAAVDDRNVCPVRRSSVADARTSRGNLAQRMKNMHFAESMLSTDLTTCCYPRS